MDPQLSGVTLRLVAVSDEEDLTQPGGDEPMGRELTPEERETVRRLGQLSKVTVPRINLDMPPSVLRNLTGALGIAGQNKRLIEAISPAIKLTNLGMQGLDARGLLGARHGLASLASGHSTLLDSIKPALVASELVGKQSAFAQLGAAQTAWTSQLMKNADLGVSKQMAAAVKQFTASQSKVWESVAASTRQIVRSFYPSNLRDVEGVTLSAVKAVAFDEGIPLYLVPRQETAELLLAADDLGALRDKG